MSTAPFHPGAAPGPTETLDERFQRLAAAWHRAVAVHSSSTIRHSHPTYRAIIDLGPPVIPLLLRDVSTQHTHWFAALREITGANPVPEALAGNIPAMANAWLQWARENGIAW